MQNQTFAVRMKVKPDDTKNVNIDVNVDAM